LKSAVKIVLSLAVIVAARFSPYFDAGLYGLREPIRKVLRLL
jgi:hypothetical protein